MDILDALPNTRRTPERARQDTHCLQCDAQLIYETHWGNPSRGIPTRTVVVCGVCRHPVANDHPLQKELDRQAAERVRGQQEQEAKIAKAPPNPAGSAYEQSQPLQAILDVLQGLQARMTQLEKMIERRLQALEARDPKGKPTRGS